eukprot:COSAG02_NODE_1396_length_12898_cov_23.802953_4_plen_84_part_00
MDSTKISDYEISVNRILTDQLKNEVSPRDPLFKKGGRAADRRENKSRLCKGYKIWKSSCTSSSSRVKNCRGRPSHASSLVHVS